MRRLSAIALWLKSAGVTHKNDPSARQHKYPNSLAFAPIFHGVVAVWKAGGAFVYFAFSGHAAGKG